MVAATLTNEEETILRKHVYSGLRLGLVRTADGWPHTGVAVSIPVTELHRKKRVATLRLLLEIVKGGRPDDALSATACAVALELNPFHAEPLAYYPLDEFDTVSGKNERSERQILVHWVEELFANAEKQERSDK